ncbi:MAG: hypothetical protein ABR526_04470 [Chthoniobacterales bacterium]
MKTSANNDRRGAALLLSLWALFLLSAVVISWALDIDSRLTLNGNANRVMEAEAMAASGSEIATHPAVKPGSPLLRGGVNRTQTFDARITGEGGRLNLNWIALNAAQPSEQGARCRELLRRYLEIKGVELNDRDRMIDCLLDWVDSDNEIRLNGAEAEGDYRPSNRLLTRIDEMKRIHGWEEFTANDGWDADFTITSGQKVDVRWASRDILLALGFGEQAVDDFLTLRRGSDGEDGTQDDPTLSSDEAWRALGITAPQQQLPAILQVAGFDIDHRMRVVSVGRSASVTRTIEMVVDKPNGQQPILIAGTWKEY